MGKLLSDRLSGAVSEDAALLQRRGVPMHHVAWSAAALETHPHIVRQVHEDHIAAGAEVITANSFGTSRHVLEPAGMGDQVAELNRRAIQLAREARDRALGTGMKDGMAQSVDRLDTYLRRISR